MGDGFEARVHDLETSMTEVKVEQGRHGERLTNVEDFVRGVHKSVDAVKGMIVKGAIAIGVTVFLGVIVNGLLLKLFNGG